MSTSTRHTADGTPIPFTAIGPHEAGIPVAPHATLTGARLHTGKAESEWLGAKLIELASTGGTWQRVPWRMLRNEYLRLSAAERERRAAERAPPPPYEHQPVVEYEVGSATIPEPELRIGFTHMVRNDLISLTQHGPERETYVFPTAKLLACAVTREHPMTADRHRFPFGRPQ